MYWGSHGSQSAAAAASSWCTKAYDEWVYGSELLDQIKQSGFSGSVFFMLDSCYSGSMVELIEHTDIPSVELAALSSTGRSQTAWCVPIRFGTF